MKRLVIILVLFGFNTSLVSQDTFHKPKLYRSWIYKMEGKPYRVNGVLYQFKDSTIVLSSSYKAKKYLNDDFFTIQLAIKNVKEIEYRKKNNVIKGALIGLASGFFVGGIIGYAQGNRPASSYPLWMDRTQGQNMAGFGIAFGMLGAGIGALFGTNTIRIPINGNQKKYEENLDRLNQVAIKKK